MADLHRDPIAIVLAAINGYTAQHGGSGSGATTVIVGGTGLLFLPPLWLPLIKWFLAIPHYIVLLRSLRRRVPHRDRGVDRDPRHRRVPAVPACAVSWSGIGCNYLGLFIPIHGCARVPATHTVVVNPR